MSAIGVLFAVLALVTALGGVVNAGMDADYVEGVVRRVDPAGIAWRAGVRPGQAVLSVRAADEPGGWAIEARAGPEVIRLEGEGQAELLAMSRPVAVAAAALAVAAVTQLPRRRRFAEAGAALVVVLASVPIAIAGDRAASSAALGLATMMPLAWLVRWTRLRRRTTIALLVFAFAFVGVWFALRESGSPAFGTVEQVRLVASIAATLAMLGLLVGGRQLSLAMVSRPRLIDAATLGAIVALGAALLLAGLPPLVVAAGIVAVVMLYPAFRRTALRLLDRAFLAEERERLALAVSEAERARLAREIHDAPLQDLAGVIQSLEALPGSEAQREALREVAQQLRRVTSELHPPVLDDLGLLPAIEFLVNRTRRGQAAAIRVEVDDSTSLRREERPPTLVELGLFRIVQEALGNAMRHAQASEVRIHGVVSPERVALSVADDGIGINNKAAEAAMRQGRLGLASMRRRAEAIAATLTIGRPRGGPGTEVTVRWEADA